jgi:DNA-binding transcriptional LysR family regulator
MELHEARYFLAMSRTLNFTRAAEVCNVTQPALTRAIQKIEDELGGLLFSRERSNTHLTELGRMLQPQFEAMIENAETLRKTATRFLRLEGAQMTVGVMCTIGPTRFVSFLSRFRGTHPGIDLTLIEAVPNRLSELLVAADIDVAIMAQSGGFPAPLSAQPIYTERFVVACALTHRFVQRNSVRMADLDGEIYLQRVNCEYRDYLAEQLRERGAEIARSYRSEREDWIQTMVAAGMGICFARCFTPALKVTRRSRRPTTSSRP